MRVYLGLGPGNLGDMAWTETGVTVQGFSVQAKLRLLLNLKIQRYFSR